MRLVVRVPIGQNSYWMSFSELTSNPNCIIGYSPRRDPQRARIRGYWGVENKVHYVRDVTQGEDASRTRMHGLPEVFAVARNFALNLYRSNDFKNMA